jgi:vacuolar-type H+-ATPase subunit H
MLFSLPPVSLIIQTNGLCAYLTIAYSPFSTLLIESLFPSFYVTIVLRQQQLLANFQGNIIEIVKRHNHQYQIPFSFGPYNLGGLMAKSDVLRAIKDAEVSAAATISDAQAKAAKIISDARLEAADLHKNSTGDSHASMLSIIDAAKDEAGIEAAKVAKSGDAEIKKLHSSGDKRRKEAVNFILSSLNE